MPKELRTVDLVYVHDFANIMGVSIPTIKKWMLKGYLNDIRKVATPHGIQFHIFDIFRYANPEADKNTIELMIFEYRMSQTRAKKASQNRKYRRKKTRG